MFRFALAVGLVVGAVVMHSGEAHAGRSFFGWLYGPEVMPERGVELQTWVWEENRSHDHNTSMLWAPFLGITDQLEIGFPVTARWLDAPTKSFTIDTYGIEARYRFVSPDPVDKPAFAPLARVAVKRDILARSTTLVEADLVGAYDFGRAVQLLADVGFYGSFATDDGVASEEQLRPGAGISFETVEDLRFGVEGYGELSLKSGGDRWYGVGPNMAYTHGRMWLSGAFLVGVTGIRTAPRFSWGILF